MRLVRLVLIKMVRLLTGKTSETDERRYINL